MVTINLAREQREHNGASSWSKGQYSPSNSITAYIMLIRAQLAWRHQLPTNFLLSFLFLQENGVARSLIPKNTILTRVCVCLTVCNLLPSRERDLYLVAGFSITAALAHWQSLKPQPDWITVKGQRLSVYQNDHLSAVYLRVEMAACQQCRLLAKVSIVVASSSETLQSVGQLLLDM